MTGRNWLSAGGSRVVLCHSCGEIARKRDSFMARVLATLRSAKTFNSAPELLAAWMRGGRRASPALRQNRHNEPPWLRSPSLTRAAGMKAHRLKTMCLNLPRKLLARNAQQAGGNGLVLLGAKQRAVNVFTLHLGQRRPFMENVSHRRRRFDRDRALGTDDLTLWHRLFGNRQCGAGSATGMKKRLEANLVSRQKSRPLKVVLQFADVPRPAVRPHAVQAGTGKVLLRH